MNVYCFYLRLEKIVSEKLPDYSDIEDAVEMDGETVSLYAYTSKKKYAKEFMEMRNMDKFIPIKLKMTEEEYRQFQKESYYSKRLDYYAFDVRDCDGTPTYFSLLTSGLESEYYQSCMEYIEDVFILTLSYANLMYDVLPCIKDKWLKEIGVPEIDQIMRMANKISIGESVPIILNGMNVILSTFGELFK